MVKIIENNTGMERKCELISVTTTAPNKTVTIQLDETDSEGSPQNYSLIT
ncbi:hypothetical protein VQ7734_03677 [Vibrio quintilis]|uniref:Uncharacterized protein n=1 Tax=Vibrio quintilis TaxID=1117707 RepID=A0A1M7YYY6_9VIBR|nr:hypothetical protein VQ7734_03677 [Vibrio quintilis]